MIYFDHHASTPLTKGVLVAMSDVLEQGWANPSSVHALGRVARRYQEEARDAVAAAIGAQPADVVLCGGGTEACNLGVLGLSTDATAIATTEVEHPAVEEAVLKAGEAGKRVHRLTLDAIDSGVREARLGKNDLLAIQWVNHEIGSIADVVASVHAAKETGARVFRRCDPSVRQATS